ncbi:UMF1 family MFS transporter [Kordia periserrulae]|uniref:UMF1 family MFS transporter n=1 Tax=Kordia periserrulae TaxID=701523 RepID=A0A2T6BXT1_9FLAO|nr:MFS transporter [Kordia periserrulae]PTX60889.1 UMF1 family MFS transporter [Kordia periserrulae]
MGGFYFDTMGKTTRLQKGDKKLISAWAFYDWANSVYSLVVSTAVFPIYYAGVTKDFDSYVEAFKTIKFLGVEINPTSLYNYTVAFFMFIVAIISPILSGIADYTGNKLKFLKFFCLLGSLSIIGLFFFENEATLWVGLVLTITSGIGFWGSIVFYNAYLPEVAHPEQQDQASAKGFIMGYIGSIILLIICLVMIMKHDMFGFNNAGEATRLSFIIVGLWWLGFAQITYRRLPNNVHNKKPKKGYLTSGFKELAKVWKELKNYASLRTFLISFFLFSVGVQTIIYMAGIFGSDELDLPSENLISAILLVQFVAIFGAYIFSRISVKYGNITALKITIVIWGLVCFVAFSLDKDQENIQLYFYSLGGLIGLVLGAIQSLSRSTYSKLLPETEDTATYFSFYDVTEKIAIVVGMFGFGLLNEITGSMQWSVLFLAVFFLLSFIILSFVKKTKYVQ